MRWLNAVALTACAVALSGCGSLIAEGSSVVAGIAGGAIASHVTDNATAAIGIGIGVQAATRSAVQYGQRKIHGEAQQQIADVAGALQEGQVREWKTTLSLPLESDEGGRVTVSRTISSGQLECKEIVLSIDRRSNKPLLTSEFYIASICRNGRQWAWATAEPATERWGSLQ